jgi:hypothetical protein
MIIAAMNRRDAYSTGDGVTFKEDYDKRREA